MNRGILVGCCGFALARAKYFRTFKVVEIQQSFYEMPKTDTARRWRGEAPKDFTFTVKAWQLITHEPTSPTYRRLRTRLDSSSLGNCGSFKPTEEVFWAWERTLEFASALEARVVVFQCPSSFRPTPTNLENMRNFFTTIPREGLLFAWEPRGQWPDELVGSLCRGLDLIHCVDPFKELPAHGNINYFRLHGVTGYAYSFTDEDLERLLAWCQGKESYVLFNNISMGEDALRFMAIAHGDIPKQAKLL
jgi:uncharacterized protein YecE (DUF72 family)